MNVLFISQCSGNALTETRRILDCFSERCGERTWQTTITKQGLDAVYTELKKTARKNTAVLCRWIHGANNSDIVWIVGDSSRFNATGAVPTESTQRPILRNADENNWHTVEDIRLITALAALWHDYGKANAAFQKKIMPNQSKKVIADPLRHEWISARLFTAFVRVQIQNFGKDNIPSDTLWLARLGEISSRPLSKQEESDCLNAVQKDSKQDENDWLQAMEKNGEHSDGVKLFKDLPPLASAVAWLILGHHRLPVSKINRCDELIQVPQNVKCSWNYANLKSTASEYKGVWKFGKNSFPWHSDVWRKRTAKIADKLLNRQSIFDQNWLDNAFAMHIGRMILMLADHDYSSRTAIEDRLVGDEKYTMYANTCRATGQYNQKLDEHLVGTEKLVSSLIHWLPDLRSQLASLGVHKAFRQRTTQERFRWQDTAYTLAKSLAVSSKEQGFFGVNLASTGCGKTFANGRICYGLGEDSNVRFTVALGLRTLTLQTGEAYRQKLGLGEADVAVLAGTAAIRELYAFDWAEKNTTSKKTLEKDTAEEFSETVLFSDEAEQNPLLPPETILHYSGEVQGEIAHWLRSSSDAAGLLYAPVLSCTIDHIIPASEGIRGGRQIAPMLRLLTSDLVLDEPDDFSVEDLYALTRLVYWAGLLGSRVLLSSATIPPSLAQGLFHAYNEGRKAFCKNVGAAQHLPVCCAWFDEFGAQGKDIAEDESFNAEHTAFIQKRIKNLAAHHEQRRCARIHDMSFLQGMEEQDFYPQLAETVVSLASQLHEENATLDDATGKRISFGVLRMANINPLTLLAKQLCTITLPENVHLHLCCYHSRFPLCQRSAIEATLDNLLHRNMDDSIFLAQKQVRSLLESDDAMQHIVLILATSVAEVGRDHDYDWAIIEPSSVRSIVQMAGRVRRHRAGLRKKTNMILLSHNVRALLGKDKIVFCKPGFETSSFPLESHDLQKIMTEEQIKKIDASLRILERTPAIPKMNLADCEQEHLRHVMLEEQGQVNSVLRCCIPHASLCGVLQKQKPFRRDTEMPQDYYFLLDLQDKKFYRYNKNNDADVSNELKEDFVSCGEHVSFFGNKPLEELIARLTEEFSLDDSECWKKFSRISLPTRNAEQGWLYNNFLGFRRQK